MFLGSIFFSEYFFIKKLEIEKTQPNFVTSIFKTDIKIVRLVSLICKFFVNKTAKRRKLNPLCVVGSTVDLVVSCSNKKYFFKFDNCVIDT